MDRLEQLLENKLSYNFVKGDLNNDLDNIVSQIDVLDGIVFNNGILDYKPLKFIDETDFLKIFHTNYFSSIFLLKKLAKKKN